MAGYREAGGVVEFTDSARARIALYRLYLALIILVENGPRQYPEEDYASLRDLSAGRAWSEPWTGSPPSPRPDPRISFPV